MKNSRLFTAILLMISMHILGQNNLAIYGNTGINSMNLTGTQLDIIPLRSTHQLAIGINTDIVVGNSLTFQPGLHYAKSGFSIYQSTFIKLLGLPLKTGVGIKTSLQYIEAPMMLKYRLANNGIRPFITAGPKFSYMAQASIVPIADLIVEFEINRTRIDLKSNNINRLGIAGQIGAGVDIPVGDNLLTFAALYNHGFSTPLTLPIVNLGLQNRGYHLSLGYRMYF